MNTPTARLLAVFVIAVLFGFLITQAKAHDWYDSDCCSTQDCAPAPVGSVTATDTGWQVIILPGEHPMVKRNVSTFVPFGDPREKRSKDARFHACITPGQRFLCLYVPGAQG